MLQVASLLGSDSALSKNLTWGPILSLLSQFLNLSSDQRAKRRFCARLGPSQVRVKHESKLDLSRHQIHALTSTSTDLGYCFSYSQFLLSQQARNLPQSRSKSCAEQDLTRTRLVLGQVEQAAWQARDFVLSAESKVAFALIVGGLQGL